MSTTPITRLPSEQEEMTEEALSEIFEAFETGAPGKKELETLLDERECPVPLAELQERRLVGISGEAVILTPSGESLARSVLRRKRLAERLLKDVLNVPDEFIEPAACQWEHILSKEVVDSICTLLGHPRQSPRDRAIPPGECCKSAATRLAPVVCPLSKVEAGRKAKVAYLLMKQHPELDRLLTMGLVPGTTIEVIQRFPTFVVQANESQLAFDEGIAEGVFVHPRP